MTSGLVLAIDQGTTNTKALAFDPDGRVVASASVPMSVAYPHPGWAEQSPLEIWSHVQHVIAEVVREIRSGIDALAISNQRETIIVWDITTGEPIAPAILWQCRRTAERCAALRRAGYGMAVEAKTGLPLDPLFPAAKIAWILDNVAGARAAAQAGRLRAGTVDAWLLWKLTGGGVFATDHSNASRTQLFDIQALAWDDELARIFDVPLSLLPEVRRSDSAFGATVAGTTALPAGIPIHAMIGDSHAALYGQGIRKPGTVKATYGTGSSLMTLTAKRVQSRHGLSSTIAWSTQGGVAYALEGNISVSGQAAAFMAELLGLGDAGKLADLAMRVPDSNGVTFVPALIGLGAPYWEANARGIVTGLALGTKPAHLARAAIEAIAFQVTDVYAAMEADAGHALRQLSADGGAARNDFLMQFQADLINRPVIRSDLAEVSAAGAAMLAFAALGSTGEAIATTTQFTPRLDATTRARLLDDWHDAVDRAIAPNRTSKNETERRGENR
ncbi:MAG: glycerol kinase GlpK [Devosia sp.]|nr:glycerol kinase GlpK [Devosia sp.]